MHVSGEIKAVNLLSGDQRRDTALRGGDTSKEDKSWEEGRNRRNSEQEGDRSGKVPIEEE